MNCNMISIVLWRMHQLSLWKRLRDNAIGYEHEPSQKEKNRNQRLVKYKQGTENGLQLSFLVQTNSRILKLLVR